jgi:hypothetical protein
MSRTRPIAAALAILGLAMVPPMPGPDAPGGFWPGGWLVGPAWADDDGGDDDGGDDDGDDDDGGDDDRFDRGRDRVEDRGRRPGGSRGQNRRSSGQAAPRPDFAPELVVRDLTETDLVALLAEGFGLLERITLPGGTLTRLAAPAGLTLDGARDRVRALPAAPATDFNHYYRTGQGAAIPAAQPADAPCRHANCAAWGIVGWPADGAALPGCAVGLTVGVIDTGVNLEHDQIAGATVELIRLAPDAAPPSGRVHGTAVVSLLAGQRDDRVAGLIPAAQILAIDIFTRAGADERADAVSLVRALEEMAGRGVRLVNLSLAGPPNAVLAEALDRLTGPGGMVVIAAVGNGGPQADPVQPAAHPGVVAVTAVDARGRLYAAAQRGGHVDLAAPGVNLTVATSIRGARAQSGTSFAVPFVTAAAAVLLSREPDLDGPGVAARLAALARDQGAPGRDPLYGAGVLDVSTLCG